MTEKTFRRCAVIAAICALLSCSAALAADNATAPQTSKPLSFREMDLNNDGYVSQEEALKMGMRMEEFHKADKNGDGRLDHLEFKTYMKIFKGISF